MKNILASVEVLCVLISTLAFFTTSGAATKYRICVIEAGKSKKIAKFCPELAKDDSQVECVIASNRIECLMKITQGKADFTVLEAEDIVVASNTRNTDVLVTNTVRFVKENPNAYEVIAIVRNSLNVGNLADLQGTNLCHSGYGYEPLWTDVISRFFEARVVPQLCNSSLTLAENRIKSSSTFFRTACKAGPWVPNLSLDAELKRKYPNLCEICDNPNSCSTLDKYWGRLGPLFCLTDGQGDVAWVRTDDARQHFALGLPDSTPMGDPKDYSYLCADGQRQSLTTADPCVWLARPWPAVVASKETAARVQAIVSDLNAEKVASSYASQGWQWSLDRLMTVSTAEAIVPLTAMTTAEDFLKDVTGFTSANSLSDCTPGRPIRVCTSSPVEVAKCGWLKEAAKAYGIEPDLDCLQARTPQDCLQVVQRDAADVVFTRPDLQLVARRDYGLSPLMYEFSTNVDNLYNAAAVVKSNSPLRTLEDLRGRKACFPSYEGVAWTSAIEILKNRKLLPKTCPYTKAVGEYFSDSCVPGLRKSSSEYQSKLKSLCHEERFDPLLVPTNSDNTGELEAFRCLVSGEADVAFIDLATVRDNTDGANNLPWATNLKSNDFRSLCDGNSTKKCFLAWATPGQIMMRANTSALRAQELMVTFLNLDNSFGKRYKTHTPAFQMFGTFDGNKNVMFHDATHRLEDYESLRRDGPPAHNYEEMIHKTPICSAGSMTAISAIALLWSAIFSMTFV